MKRIKKWKQIVAAGMTCLILLGQGQAAQLVAHAEPKAADLYIVQGVTSYIMLLDEPEASIYNEIGQLHNGDLFYNMSDPAEEYWYGYTQSGQMGYVMGQYLVSAEEADYYIGSGMEYSYEDDDRIFETDYFSVAFPAEYEWTHELINSTTIKIIYEPAAAAGYGGTVMSVIAFDPTDTEYTEYPSWFIAGGNMEKTYVVLTPTDLQRDPEDEVQMEEYGKMLEKVKEIYIKK